MKLLKIERITEGCFIPRESLIFIGWGDILSRETYLDKKLMVMLNLKIPIGFVLRFVWGTHKKGIFFRLRTIRG